MGIEQTLVLVKPDALEKGIEFEVLKKISDAGFSFPLMYKTRASEALLREHYAGMLARISPEIGRYTLESMMEGPLIAAIAEGKDAAEAIRELGGSKFNPPACKKGTIRYDFSTDTKEIADSQRRGIHNVLHTSDSKASAERELGLWFGKYLPNYFNRYDEECPFSEIAEMIQYPYPDLIKSIAGVSNENKLLYNGIKNAAFAKQVEKEGARLFKPWYNWNTGLTLFYPLIDSAFFDDSGELDSDGKGLTELNLAVANHDMLVKDGIKVSSYIKDNFISIADTVPYKDIALLKARVRHPETYSQKELRRYRQIAELMLLQTIDSQVFVNFTPGKTTIHEKDIKE
jgi:nucleoside-diphosphate kinase